MKIIWTSSRWLPRDFNSINWKVQLATNDLILPFSFAKFPHVFMTLLDFLFYGICPHIPLPCFTALIIVAIKWFNFCFFIISFFSVFLATYHNLHIRGTIQCTNIYNIKSKFRELLLVGSYLNPLSPSFVSGVLTEHLVCLALCSGFRKISK